MSFNWRPWAGFGAGLLAGAAAAAWYVLGSRTPEPPAGVTVATAASSPKQPARVAADPIAAAPDSPRSKAAVACPAQSLLAAAKVSGDGRVKLETDLDGKTAADVRGLMLAGKEAAASGRPRDAEIAFMLACRVAVQRIGAGSIEAIDANYQLAWHYANRVWTGGAGSQRAALLARAEQLYGESLAAYAAHHGPDHERSRFAAQGLARVQEAAGTGPPTAPAVAAPAARSAESAGPSGPTRPAPAAGVTQSELQKAQAARAASAASAARAERLASAARAARDAREAQEERQATAAREAREARELARTAKQEREARAARADAERSQAASTRSTPAATAVRPSFDCARARSRPEKIICADAELAGLDRELGRLHSRARNAAVDPVAFKRANDREWLRREATCRDRACLLDWYAQRREQLLESLGQ